MGTLVGGTDLDALEGVYRLGLHLEVEVLVRPRHDIKNRLIVPGRDLLELGPDVLVQGLQLLGRAGEERNTFDPHERLIADLLGVEIVGDRHQPVAHGAQAFGSLEAELAPGLDVDLDRPAGRLLHLFGEAPAVDHVEVGVRPYRRHRQLHRRLRTHHRRCHHQGTSTRLQCRPASQFHGSPQTTPNRSIDRRTTAVALQFAGQAAYGSAWR